MYSAHIFTWLTICIYLIATFLGITGMLTRRSSWLRAGCWLAVAAFICQTFFLFMGFHKTMPHGLSTGAYLQLLAWFCLLCGLFSWWRFRHDALLLFATPLGLILFLMSPSVLNIGTSLPQNLHAPFFTLHIGALFLSLGLLTIASIAALIFLFLEKKIKSRKNMAGFWENMPALSLLDKMNYLCILLSFIFYTIGLIAGLFWARPIFGFNGDPKEIISIIIWVLMAALFHNRLAKGWHGRKPAILTLIIFVLCLVSVLIVNLFIPTYHDFIRG